MSDYVIVGAGSAGCVLAERLTADPNVTVTLLEAGGPDDNPAVHDPAAFLTLRGTDLDWRYRTEPQSRLDQRRIDWPRGKVLGGSSAINYLLYMRGNPADYDAWATAGNPDWSWANMLPLFIEMEDSPRGAGPFHGIGGPLTLTDQTPPDAGDHPFLQAGAAAWHPVLEDFFSEKQEGFSRLQLTIGNGRRVSAADAWLRPALQRPNLTVITGAHVTRLNINHGRAASVRYRHDGQERHLTADREILVTAGTIGSPHLLMLSGIGPADHLRAHDITVAADVPGVGSNLHDHPAVVTAYTVNAETDWPGWHGAGAFLRSGIASGPPDLQLLYNADPATGSIAVYVINTAPRSRGTIRLRSNDPVDTPIIDPSYLSDPRDTAVLTRGVNVVADLLASSPFARVSPAAVTPPNPAHGRSSDLAAWITAHLESAAHPVGTCKMGPALDPSAVVDNHLRVHGIKGLRVIDASVMPTIVNANTNAPVYAIAYRATQLIEQQPAVV